jgi:8-oxo-dGTP pyrophosphatase MutT (NUDIX family)
MDKPKINGIKHSYAGVYIVTKSGKVAGQHRDNKPNIDWPDKIGPFGGAIENNEAPVQAAWRELVLEETNLHITVDELRPITSYVAWRTMTKEYETLNFFYIVVDDETLQSMEVYEGQGWSYISGSEASNLTETTREAVKALFEILKSNKLNQ